MFLRPRVIRSSASRLLLSTCVVAATASALRAQEADPPMTPERFAMEQRQALAQIAALAPETPAKPIDSLIRLDLVNGHLAATPVNPTGTEDLNFSPGGDKLSRFRMALQQIVAPNVPTTPIVGAHLMKLDVANSRAMNVQLLPWPAGLNMSVTIETLQGTTTAQLVETRGQDDEGDGPQPPIVRLYMQRADTPNAADKANLNISAVNFSSLVESNHDDVLAMLGEGLTALRAMHVLSGIPQAEALSLLKSGIPLGEAAQREVESIFTELRNGGSAKMPELRARLRKLGSGAAAALHARPRDGWPADLALNVDTLTADLLPGGANHGSPLLKSKGRLINLLYAPDVEVRRAALAHLSTLTGQPVKLDVEADPYANVPLIESLRGKVAPPAPLAR